MVPEAELQNNLLQSDSGNIYVIPEGKGEASVSRFSVRSSRRDSLEIFPGSPDINNSNYKGRRTGEKKNALETLAAEHFKNSIDMRSSVDGIRHM